MINHNLPWKPVTDALKADPRFKAIGINGHGTMFVFWTGGDHWLRQTDGSNVKVCFPEQYLTLDDACKLIAELVC